MAETAPSDLTHYRAWIALSQLPGIGSRTVLKLLQYYHDDPHRCLAIDEGEMRHLRLPLKTCDAIKAYQAGRWPDPEGLTALAAWLEGADNHLLTLDSEDYPALLRQIDDPPLLLYVQGDVTVLHLPQIAIVGSRSASRHGIQLSGDFTRALVRAGLVVTSGLARGVDGAAHRASVTLEKPTVAVLGSGLEVIYPRQHQQLARDIVATGGALISEYPLTMPPLAHNFPRRNRIISGLCAGVLVVEATQRSGSLITARLALEQGREVFALPGALNNPQTHGCHALIREGGQLVEHVGHIIDALGALLGSYVPEAPQPGELKPEASVEEAWLLEHMGYQLCSLEALIERTGANAGQLMALLVAMELKGLICQQPDGYLRTA